MPHEHCFGREREGRRFRFRDLRCSGFGSIMETRHLSFLRGLGPIRPSELLLRRKHVGCFGSLAAAGTGPAICCASRATAHSAAAAATAAKTLSLGRPQFGGCPFFFLNRRCRRLGKAGRFGDRV